MNELREGLPPLPEKMRSLHIDERGYPVPYFVALVDGKPDHRIVEPRRMRSCMRDGLCWICGRQLGVYKVFVVGPMCAVNMVSGEPPSHYECAAFAAVACPFLSRPRAKRREAHLPDERHTNEGMLAHNPGVTLLWVTRNFKPFRAGGGVLFDMGGAERMEWYAEGRPATRGEVDDAIARGLPQLVAAAESDEDRSAIDTRVTALRFVLDIQFANESS